MERKPWICLDCRIIMDLIDEDHCKCGQCGTEVWFNYEAPDLSSIDSDHVITKVKVPQSIFVSDEIAIKEMMPGIKIKRKGNSKSGRRRQSQPKNPIYPYAKNYKET